MNGLVSVLYGIDSYSSPSTLKILFMKRSIIWIILLLVISIPTSKTYAQFSASLAVSVRLAPPPLPVHVQPACPVEGYLWIPGYWAYGDDGYYWVPGVWMAPPMVGYLWTPGYWGYAGGIYAWHAGYWGPHVGFYGGINYGGGYTGVGFVGGMWSGGVFRYNTAVMHVNTSVVHNTYVNNTVVRNTTVMNSRASFNGAGGVTARPTAGEEVVMREHHLGPTREQFRHNQAASRDRSHVGYLAVGGAHHAATPVHPFNNMQSPANTHIDRPHGAVPSHAAGFGNVHPVPSHHSAAAGASASHPAGHAGPPPPHHENHPPPQARAGHPAEHEHHR